MTNNDMHKYCLSVCLSVCLPDIISAPPPNPHHPHTKDLKKVVKENMV